MGGGRSATLGRRRGCDKKNFSLLSACVSTMHDRIPLSLLLPDSEQKRLHEQARQARIRAAVKAVEDAVQQMERMEATLEEGG